MIFTYKAIGPSGQGIKGQLEASNAVDLEIRLKSMHLELIRAKPAKEGRQIRIRKIPRRELINFCFHLEQLARAGVPLLEGLTDLRDSINHPAFQSIVTSLSARIEGGETLSQAMTVHPEAFNPIFINLIRAGESSGQLPEILNNLTESLKWEDELAAQTKKLLLYPAFVGGIVLAVTVFLMVFMVPQLKVFVKNMGQTLSLQTQILFAISDMLVNHGLWLLSGGVICLLAIPVILRRRPQLQQTVDALKLRLPVIGPILKKIILARFAGVLAMLYAAGIPVLEAIRSTQAIAGNRIIEQALRDAEQGITDGASISESFRATALFPPLILRMLRIGESTGRLDSTLLNVAYFYHRDIRESVGKAQTMIEPLLTLIMGTLLGWIMLSVIGPIYDVISKIKI